MNLDLHLTTDCNMSCCFCGAWEYGKEKKYIPLGEAKRVLAVARSEGYRITTFTGGEPTLYPYFAEIIEYACRLGYWTIVTTNGLEITDEIIETFRKCNTLVRVSLHSLENNLHEAITGSNTLAIILKNIIRLKESHINFAIGCTMFDKNIDRIQDIANFAWKSGASYIRYTPVVVIRGAKDINLLPVFYYDALKRIIKIQSSNIEILDYNDLIIKNRDQYLNLVLTRRCAGGSKQHIIYDCNGRILPCSFIPEEMELCSSMKGSESERFRSVYEKMNYFQEISLKGKLEGKCSLCNYSDICLGGCLTTKLPYKLYPTAEQPVCIFEIIQKILLDYSEKDKNRLIDYWLNIYKRKESIEEPDKYCMRHLPIWEIAFRQGIERSYYEFR